MDRSCEWKMTTRYQRPPANRGMGENGEMATTKTDCIIKLFCYPTLLTGYFTHRARDGNVMTTALEYLPEIFGKYMFARSIVANRVLYR